MSELKLVRWVNDGFPPIDLNENATHVKELVNEYNAAKEQVKLLREALLDCKDYFDYMGGQNHVASRPAREKVNEALNQSK